jgi:hypothetical protein
MTAVFDRYPEGGGEMLVALKLADHAEDNGTHIYPSISYIAEKTRQSPRAVQYQIRRMQQTGFLLLVANAGGGRGRAREYRINPDWINGAELAPIPSSSKGAENAPNAKGAKEDRKGATDDGKGARESTKGRKAFAPESSGTTKEPSENHQPARRAPRVALHLELQSMELPECLTFDVWDAWCEHREAKHKEAPWTRAAAKISIKRIVKLAAAGQSAEVTVEEAVLRGWTGLFPVKDTQQSAPGAAAAPSDWWKTESGYLARGQQLGVDRAKFQFFEQFKAKVCKLAGPGEWMEELLRTVGRESEERYEALYAYFNDIPREKAQAEAA